MASKLEQIEQEYGKPMPTLLEELFREHGTQVKVAQVLGITQGTISLWLMRYGLTQKTTLVKLEESK